MISFSQYIKITEQVSSTRRQGIQHLQQMSPEKFIAWMQLVKNEMGGILKNIKCVMKIDGLGFRFGKDLNGKIFIEGSTTGPIFDDNAFSAFARNKTDDVQIISRAIHYDNILKIFKTTEFMNVVPNNVKIVAELFYNPMAEETNTGIKFVTISYDKKKLGSLMTILPYTVLDAQSGQEHQNKASILNELYKESTEKIKIIDPNLKFTEIDITTFADAASVYDNESLEILKSRKAMDKTAKQNLLNIIQKIKDDLAEYILQHPGIEDKFKLGPSIEGIVLHLPNNQNGNTLPYKIITTDFKITHSRK